VTNNEAVESARDYLALRRRAVDRAVEERPRALMLYRDLLERQRTDTMQHGDKSRLTSLRQTLRLSGGVPTEEHL
jgi:hypothetical protein